MAYGAMAVGVGTIAMAVPSGGSSLLVWGTVAGGAGLAGKRLYDRNSEYKKAREQFLAKKVSFSSYDSAQRKRSDAFWGLMAQGPGLVVLSSVGKLQTAAAAIDALKARQAALSVAELQALGAAQSQAEGLRTGLTAYFGGTAIYDAAHGENQSAAMSALMVGGVFLMGNHSELAQGLKQMLPTRLKGAAAPGDGQTTLDWWMQQKILTQGLP